MDILKDFGLNPLLLGAQIVNFAILLFLLQRFLYKPILKILDERKKKIETSLKQAEDIQRTFEQTEKKSEEMLQHARKEASELVSEAKKEAKILAEEMRKEANDAAQEMIQRTQGMIVLEKEKMMSEAKKELVDMIAIATEKVAENSLEGPEKERLIKRAIEEIKK